MGWMSGEIGWFNKKRPTFGPHLYGSWSDRSLPIDRLLMDKHAGKPGEGSLYQFWIVGTMAPNGAVGVVLFIFLFRWVEWKKLLVCTRL